MRLTVKVARVYIMEHNNLLTKIVNYLHKEVKIKGITVFRAIEGIGETGVHSSSLTDLSLNLPLVIEFFDMPDNVDLALNGLDKFVKPEHVISWLAEVNER